MANKFTCPFDGDPMFYPYVEKTEPFTPEEIEFLKDSFLIQKKDMPFNVFYNLAIDIAAIRRDALLIGDQPFGAPRKYYHLAKQAQQGFIPFLKEIRLDLLGKLSEIGQIWFRAHNLCELDDPKFRFELQRTIYTLCIELDQRERLLEGFITFQIETITIKTIEKYILDEEESIRQQKILEAQKINAQKEQELSPLQKNVQKKSDQLQKEAIKEIKQWINRSLCNYVQPSDIVHIEDAIIQTLENRTIPVEIEAVNSIGELSNNDLMTFIHVIWLKWDNHTQDYSNKRITQDVFIRLMQGMFRNVLINEKNKKPLSYYTIKSHLADNLGKLIKRPKN